MNVTLPVSTVQRALRKKPSVVIAVAPKPAVTGGAPRKIIFAGPYRNELGLVFQKAAVV